MAMYEAVRVGERSTPSRIASTAAAFGFDGIVYLEDIPLPTCEEISETFGIDVARGIDIPVEDRDHTGRAILAARDEYDVLVARTRDESLQRYLAQRERLDVLAPGGPIKHTIGKEATAHGIAIEIDLGAVLRTSGADRARAFRDLRRLAHVIDTFDLSYVVTGSPSSHLKVRAPRELAALEPYVRLPDGGIDTGLENWQAIVSRARQARDDRFIEPGVRRVDNESDDR